MPWEVIPNHTECSESEPFAVVKVDNGEVEGCHVSEEAANAQLAALNIAENERALHDDEEDEDKDLHGIEALETRLIRVQEQFAKGDNANITLTFEDHFIVESGGDLFSVNYSEMNGQLVFDPREKWTQVEVSFTPRVQTDSRSWKDKLKDAAKTIFKTKDQPTEDDDIFHIGSEPFGIAIKKVNGEPWHFTWSTNAFEDREGEIFSTKALNDYVNENLANIKEGNAKKGTFDFWHLPGTDFAEKKWQGVSNGFLLETGPYLDNEIGQKAKKFFTEFPDGHPDFAPEGWGASPEFRFLPEDREDKVFDTIWIVRTSTLPRFAAANIWTEGKQIMSDQKRFEDKPRAAGVAMLGEALVQELEALSNQKATELDEAGIARKENEITEAETTQEAEVEEVVTEENEAEQPPVNIDVDVNDLATAVSEQFVLKLEPIAEAMVKMAEGTSELAERVAKLEKQEAIKARVETPRFNLNLVQRASEAVETVVGDDDDLKEKGPKQQSPIDNGASVANAFFKK